MITKQDMALRLRISRTTLTRMVERPAEIKPVLSKPDREACYWVHDIEAALAACRRASFALRGALPTIGDTWDTATSLALRLGVSKWSVIRWAKCRAIPHYRFGAACIRFMDRDAKRWVKMVEREHKFTFHANCGVKRAALTRWVNSTGKE